MITEAFQHLKTNLELNDTFDGLIQQRHNAIRRILENNGHAADTRLIGSLQRQTRIQPSEGHTFDIDILVILGSFHQWVSEGGITPEGALQKLHDAVNESDRYSAMSPEQDQPTISFAYGDNTKVELVPAYLDQIGHSPDGTLHSPAGRAYWIVKNGRWSLADYDHEAAHITHRNGVSGGYLIPVIKMLKAAKRNHIPDLGSFHLEIVAADLVPSIVQIRRERKMPISYPILITDFFKFADAHFKVPKKIPGSHSEHCSLEATAQPTILEQIEAVKDHCVSIESMRSDTEKMEAWRRLFGSPFPTRV